MTKGEYALLIGLSAVLSLSIGFKLAFVLARRYCRFNREINLLMLIAPVGQIGLLLLLSVWFNAPEVVVLCAVVTVVGIGAGLLYDRFRPVDTILQRVRDRTRK